MLNPKVFLDDFKVLENYFGGGADPVVEAEQKRNAGAILKNGNDHQCEFLVDIQVVQLVGDQKKVQHLIKVVHVVAQDNEEARVEADQRN